METIEKPIGLFRFTQNLSLKEKLDSFVCIKIFSKSNLYQKINPYTYKMPVTYGS